MLERVQAIRYVTPLREGGSLPGIVEADDDDTYVLKFRGAGQGLKVLVAEVIVGEIGRAIGLLVPDMRAVTLDARIAKYEADQEVQDLLTASVGLNLGVDFLPGSFGYDGSRPHGRDLPRGEGARTSPSGRTRPTLRMARRPPEHGRPARPGPRRSDPAILRPSSSGFWLFWWAESRGFRYSRSHEP